MIIGLLLPLIVIYALVISPVLIALVIAELLGQVLKEDEE